METSATSGLVGADVPIRPAERSSAASATNGTEPPPASCSRPPRRRYPGPRMLFTFTMLAIASIALAQTTGKTVRHHKVEVEDPSSPPELIQAESAIEKKDYATAEPLLKKVVTKDPQNFAAWFDLGFIYNALGRTDDAIAAYRESVAAKPGVFESNLNLGLTLVKAGQPDAEQFLRAATTLKPTAHAAEGQARAWLSLGMYLKAQSLMRPLRLTRRLLTLIPKTRNHIFRPDLCWKRKTVMRTRRTSTNRPLRSILPRSML